MAIRYEEVKIKGSGGEGHDVVTYGIHDPRYLETRWAELEAFFQLHHRVPNQKRHPQEKSIYSFFCGRQRLEPRRLLLLKRKYKILTMKDPLRLRAARLRREGVVPKNEFFEQKRIVVEENWKLVEVFIKKHGRRPFKERSKERRLATFLYNRSTVEPERYSNLLSQLQVRDGRSIASDLSKKAVEVFVGKRRKLPRQRVAAERKLYYRWNYLLQRDPVWAESIRKRLGLK